MGAQPQEQEDFKTTYYRLIAVYLGLLRHVASGHADWLTRSLTRWLIEDHIRVNLREIAEGLTLREYRLADPAPGDDLSWMRGQAEYLTRVADQLANLRESIIKYSLRGLAVLFTGSVLDFAGPGGPAGSPAFVLANIFGILQNLLLSSVGGVLMLAVIAIAVVAPFAIDRKRSYLKPGHDEYDPRIDVAPRAAKGPNVYQLENKLFELLGRKKPREPAWDGWGILIAVITVLAAWVAVVLGVRSIWPTPSAGIAMIIVPIIFAFGLFGRVIIRRLKRER